MASEIPQYPFTAESQPGGRASQSFWTLVFRRVGSLPFRDSDGRTPGGGEAALVSLVGVPSAFFHLPLRQL